MGDTLIEVIISALLVGLIVVGTFSGLNSTNRATSLDRARSQADALAEQNEEQLRSEPIKKLYELESHPRTETVTEGKNVYTIETSAKYISDTTATSSCTSSSAKADYLQTTSKVSSPLIGTGKSVEETGIISPPADSALIIQVTESGTALQGATATATGPAPETTTHTLETSASGCAILAVSPGEYNINVHKSAYVDPNGYENTEEDSSVTHKVYIPAETTAKEGYYLGKAGSLEVFFSSGETGDTFVAFNTGMVALKQFGTIENYKSPVLSTKPLYPFTTKYTVYAGTCEADKPPSLTSENEVLIPTGGRGETTLTLPQLKLKVWSGTSSGSTGSLVSGASGSITDTGCSSKRSFTTNTSGAMPHPGLPYGTYTLCVTAKVGVQQRRYENTTIHITSASGVEEPIYLGADTVSALPC